jgi:hypothetical protein
MTLTQEEKALLAQEVGERLKDVAYMDAHRQAVGMVEDIARELPYLDVEGTITFKFQVTMVVADFLQIVTRPRRTQEEAERQET